ncbi:MAG: DUF4166 domain-containing protein [Alphaproteobacteria bacterium]|nr:DUF4166 domain-containing protein [Alphaproteobacteria bacterium]
MTSTSGGLKLLIVGGYGTFGGRIVELLEAEPRLTLLIAGRSLARGQAYCGMRRNARAQLVPLAFDRNGDVAAQLAALRPAVLIDASGPFQAYGESRYRLIEACIAARVDYLDLADGSDFVAGVGAFDAAARAAEVFVLSGVSSFPVLTAAVVRRLAVGLARVDAIRGGIAPSPYAGVGENVIRAIAAYAGQRVPLKNAGRMGVGHPFTENVRYTITPPGRVPLRNTLFSLVDVPDLRVLPELWPEAEEVWMGAGPVPEILHRVLIGLAWLVRLRLLPTAAPLAGLMHWVTNHARWGEHRGGMFVEVAGADGSGAPRRRSWHLLAEGEDGPLIPSMAVEAIVRNVLAGRKPAAGARACVRDLELGDYEALFSRRTIYTGIRDDGMSAAAPLYARLLGDASGALPAAIRAMHDVGGTETMVACGRASVERGPGLLARLAAWIIGFPPAKVDVPVTVRFEAAGSEERWTRTFDDHSFSSRQFAGGGRSERLLCERFGRLIFAMALVVEDGRLRLVLRRWSAFGVALPMWLCPRSDSYETVEDGRFHFHVEIGHPLTGLIVRYRGWLAPPATDQAPRTIGSRATPAGAIAP